MTGRWSGWWKAWIAIPEKTLDMCLVGYAEEITCLPMKYRHLCA